MAQAVCHGLLTTEAQVPFQVIPFEIYGGQSHNGMGFLAVDCVWNVMAHGDTREGKWRGNWQMEWVASTLHTTSDHGVSSITTADAHTSAASSRLNWRPSADLNRFVRFAERRNLVSARVPSHFTRSLPTAHGRREIATTRQEQQATSPRSTLPCSQNIQTFKCCGLNPYRTNVENRVSS